LKVNFEAEDCTTRSIFGAAKYTNVTEAQLECLELGPAVCGGVGSRTCTLDDPRDFFLLCDAAWRPIQSTIGCLASPPVSIDWLQDMTDPYPAPGQYLIYSIPITVVLALTGTVYYVSLNTFAMSFVLVSIAAVSHVDGALNYLRTLDATEPETVDKAMATLVNLETEIICLINEEWGPGMAAFFVLQFMLALYYSLTVGLGIDGGTVGYLFYTMGLLSGINAHAALVPGGMATAGCVQLMGNQWHAVQPRLFRQDQNG